MTDYEMLSIVIMIITLVASLLINNRDKKKQRRHPALTGGRLNSLKGGEKPTTASSLPAVIISYEPAHVKLILTYSHMAKLKDHFTCTP